MANIKSSERHIACISANNIAVYDVGSSEKTLVPLPKPEIKEEDKHKQKPLGNEEGSERILACGFSRGGGYFAACDDYKQLALWSTGSGGQGDAWTLLSIRHLSRRCTSLTFTQTEHAVLVADKSGDVYSFSTTSPEEGGQLLLGHVSMVLDLCLIRGDSYLVTGDRDEKVRISHHPNAYNIHGYCLGHREFVSQLAYLEEDNVLITGSGDGTIKLWDPSSCEELASTSCASHVNQTDGQMEVEEEGRSLAISCLSCCQSQKLVVAGFDGKDLIQAYKVEKIGSRWQLTFVQSLTLRGALWDMTFDPSDHLHILQASEGHTLEVHTCKDQQLRPLGGSTVQTGPPGLQHTVAAINGDWDFFKGCEKFESIFSSLHKARIDNMTEYIQKKKQRMEAKKRGQEQEVDTETPPGEHSESSDSPPPKATKLDS